METKGQNKGTDLKYEGIVSFLAEGLGLPTTGEELEHLKKSDPQKVECAPLVKRRTPVTIGLHNASRWSILRR